MSQSRSTTRLHRAFRRSIGTLILAALGVAVIWGFSEGQNERAIEAAREAPVNAPLRVATVDGEPTITLDATARQNSGIQTLQLQTAPHQAEIQAYGTVLDLQSLTELSNSYTTIKAQQHRQN